MLLLNEMKIYEVSKFILMIFKFIIANMQKMGFKKNYLLVFLESRKRF